MTLPMYVISRLRRLWHNLMHRERVERDLDDELHSVFELLVDDKVRSGMSDQEARLAAALELGKVTYLKDQVRDAKAGAFVDTVLQDFRYAARSLRRTPGFTTAAVVTLALGIGAATAVFSVVYGVLLKPLPYPEPDRIIRLTEGYEGAVSLGGGAPFGSVTYHAWKDAGLKTVDVLEGYWEGGDALVEIGGNRSLMHLARVTPGLFGLLGTSPAMGRLFTADDEPDDALVVISDGVWREHFRAAPGIGGRTLRISGQLFTIVGVAPAGCAFPVAGTRLWALLDIPRPTGPRANPRYMNLQALARLRPAATADQAAAEGTVIARGIIPKPLGARITFGEGGDAFVRAATLQDEMTSGVEAAVTVVAAGVSVILLIVCVNVANLLLSRGAARHRELAVRSALGGSRARLARQLLAESVLLSLTGGALGVLAALGFVRALPLLAPTDFPRLSEVSVDERALLAALAAAVTAAVVSALAPIVSTTRIDLASAFRGAGPGAVSPATPAHRLRTLLLAAESAFAVVLMVCAMLLARSFVKLVQVDAGYTAEGVVIAEVLRPDTTEESARRYAPLMRIAVERVRALPGVVAAGLGSMSPLDPNTSLTGFPVPGTLATGQPSGGGSPAPRTALTRSYAISPGYERALGLRLLSGRFLTDTDGGSNDVRWMVNAEFARLYLPPNPAGLRFPWRRGDQDTQLEIVGVVANVLKDGNAGVPLPEIYRVLRPTEPFFNYQIVVRTAGEVDAIVPALQNAVREAAPDATVNAIAMADRFSESVAEPRLATAAFGALAALASMLTAVGIFAALSHRLSQRRRELGVRVAIGACRIDLILMLISQGVTPTLIGIGVGMIVAGGVSQAMRAVLFGIAPIDAISFMAAPLVLIPVALAACLLPALRASRVNPMASLRAE